MANSRTIKFIIVIIIIFNTLGVICSAMAGNLIHVSTKLSNENNFIEKIYVLLISNTCVLDFMLYMLLKLIDSIESKDFFYKANVGRLKKISLCSWFLAISNTLMNILANRDSILNLEIIAFITIAIFAKVLSYIFNQGKELKDSEASLREKCKLTI